jgi:hypothetical protein
MIQLFLTRLGLWIARLGYWPAQTLIDRAGILCQSQERADATSEYKRHQVYAQLIKEFPTTPKRQIGLAIELALTVGYGH